MFNTDDFSHVYSKIDEKSSLPFSVTTAVPSSNSGDGGILSVAEIAFFGFFFWTSPFSSISFYQFSSLNLSCFMCINVDAFSYVYFKIDEKSRLFSVMAAVPIPVTVKWYLWRK